MKKHPLIGYKTKYGEVLTVGIAGQLFESAMLPGDKLNHLVTMDGRYCTCDPMPIGYNDLYYVAPCLHRENLRMHMEKYNELPDEKDNELPDKENDDWLEFINEQDDRRTLWMM
jgi:hypothetical protein